MGSSRLVGDGRFYTGVGSRATPPGTLKLMRELATRLASDGWTLRSGHCVGADRAFEEGAGGRAHVFLPWKSYGVKPYKDDPGVPVLGEVRLGCDADTLAAYDELVRLGIRSDLQVPRATRLLHGRNHCQVMGEWGCGEPASEFLVCWAEEFDDGTVKGGTATAVNLARIIGIPVWNLFLRVRADAVRAFLAGDKESLAQY